MYKGRTNITDSFNGNQKITWRNHLGGYTVKGWEKKETIIKLAFSKVERRHQAHFFPHTHLRETVPSPFFSSENRSPRVAHAYPKESLPNYRGLVGSPGDKQPSYNTVWAICHVFPLTEMNNEDSTHVNGHMQYFIP